MASGMMGDSTSSTASEDLRVAAGCGFSTAWRLSALMVEPSLRGSSPRCVRFHSLRSDSDRASRRSFQAARACAPRRPTSSHQSLISEGTSKGPAVQP